MLAQSFFYHWSRLFAGYFVGLAPRQRGAGQARQWRAGRGRQSRQGGRRGAGFSGAPEALD